MHLNSADNLPPVDCRLVVELPCGAIVGATRTSHIETRAREMEYRLECGAIVHGRFKWTYP